MRKSPFGGINFSETAAAEYLAEDALRRDDLATGLAHLARASKLLAVEFQGAQNLRWQAHLAIDEARIQSRAGDVEAACNAVRQADRLAKAIGSSVTVRKVQEAMHEVILLHPSSPTCRMLREEMIGPARRVVGEDAMTKSSRPKPTKQQRQAPEWPLLSSHPLRQYLTKVLSESPCGLCTDIDGTISATAPTVDQAVLLPDMRELLQEATETFDLVATVSGRAVEDQRRMIGVPGVWHTGHHGYEWEELDSASGVRRVVLLPEAEPYLAEVTSALDAIEEALAPVVPGLWMERKGITGGIHWRLAADHDGTERLCVPVIKRIAEQHGLRARASKLAVEIFPPIVTDKGAGMRRLIEMHHLRGVIYLGDDVSDTDAFQMLRALREQREGDGVAVAVMHANAPTWLTKAADIVVRDVIEVPGLVRWLIGERIRLTGDVS
jgi:trehalose 6-phosphate phosphatase